MKKKVFLVISIISVLLMAMFFGLFVFKQVNKANFEKKVAEAIKSEYKEIELNSTNCDYTVNEETTAVDISGYYGNEACVIIPEKIEEKEVENIDVNMFSDCYNLEEIKVPKKLAEKIENIPDFEIDEELSDEEYTVYKTTREYSEIYLEYITLPEEEKIKSGVIPNKFDVPLEKIYSPEMENLYNVSGINDEQIEESYDLRDHINIKVENQESFGICYAYASLASVETNLALTTNENYDFSEIQAAVMTTGNGGYLFNYTDDYYKNKIGPVFEEDYSMKDIYGNSTIPEYAYINQYLDDESTQEVTSDQKAQMQEYASKRKATKYITETVSFPTINQSFKNDSNYEERVKAIRNTIKKHIKQYGSVAICIAASNIKEYNGKSVLYDTSSSVYNHGVSIVGWDDNFSKNNFPSGSRPSKDGAYLVLNSWGEFWGESGYFWVSYEDKFVETNLRGVVSVNENTANIHSTSMNIIDLNTNETIKNDSIKKGENVKIQTEITVDNLTSGDEISVKIRDSEKDYTDNISISSTKIVNNKVDLTMEIDTNLTALAPGQYIIEISYGDETINKEVEIQGFIYTVNSDNTITITDYNDTEKDVVIPEVYDGYVVSKIGKRAFYKKDINSIKISNNITEISSYAFRLCKNLKKIEFSDKRQSKLKTIGERAFDSCTSLEKVVFPSNLETIADYAFCSCSNLKYVKCSRGVTTIKLGAFYACPNIEKIVIFKQTISIGIGLITDKINCTIYGEDNSVAKTYATNKNINYQVLSNYTVSYDANAGSDEVLYIPNSQTMIEEDEVCLSSNIPTRDGYIFAGWATTADAINVEYHPNDYYEENSDVTLYAVWESSNKEEVDVNKFIFEDKTFEYDGKEKEIESTGQDEAIVDVKYSITGDLTNGKIINAGIYQVTAEYSIKDPRNYEFRDGINKRVAKITINKATYNMTAIKFYDGTFTYDGQPKKIEIQGELPEGVTVSYENNNQTETGEYMVTAVFNGDSKNYHSIPKKTAKLIIKKQSGSITITNKSELSKIYDGTPIIDPIYEKVGDGEVVIEYYNGDILLAEKPIKSGIYKVKAILKDGANYSGAVDEAIFEIQKITYDMSNVKFENKVFTYDGTPKKIEITGELPEGVTVSYENNIRTECGEQTAIAKFAGETENHNAIPNMTAKLIIGKVRGSIEITNKKELSKVYDGTPITDPTYTKVGDGEVTVEYYKNDVLLSEKPVNAGSYKIRISISESKNYTSAVTELNIEIAKATYDMSKVKFEDTVFIYDGAEKKLEITGELPEGVTVSYENNTRTESGKQIATAKFTGDTENYNTIKDKTAELIISKAKGSIKITNKEELNRTYDGTPIIDPIYEKIGDGEVVIEYYKGEILLSEKPINAGIYKVKVILKESENYSEATDEVGFQISKATYDMSKVKFEDATYTYDGTPKKIEITGELPEGVTVSYENNEQTSVGEYTAIAKFTGNTENYNTIPNMTAKLVIGKITGTLKITNKENLGKIYNGSQVDDPTYEKNGDGTVAIEYYEENKLLSEKPINAGKYKVKVILNPSETYTGAMDEAEFEIRKATYDMSKVKFEDTTYTYDGTEKKLEISGELPKGVNVSYENNIRTESGEQEAIAKFVGDSKNYNLIENKIAKLIIIKAGGKIQITNKSELSKVYDGEPNIDPTYDEVKDGVVVIEYYKNETLLLEKPVNAGKYKVKLILKNSKNYTDTTDEAEFEIYKATYDMSKVKFDNSIFTYDGTEKKVEVSGELPEGVTVSYENNTRTESGEQVAVAKFAGDKENYNLIENKTAKLIINKAKGSITITNKSDLAKIYDKTPIITPTYIKVGDGDVVIEYYKDTTLLEKAPINAGTYRVKVILEEGKNYSGASDEISFEIKKATYDMSEVKFEDATFKYDGTEKKIEITGELPEGVTVSYENNVQIGSGEYTAIARFTGDNENYNDIPEMKAKIIIESIKGILKITNKEELNKTYDGNPVINPIYEKVGDGDVAIEYYKGEMLLSEKPINAGVYKVKVCLKDGRNYTKSSDEAEFEIRKATYDMSAITFEDATFTYDGEPKKIEITGKLPEGVNVSYENNIQIDSGEYEVVAKFIGNDENYNTIPNKVAKLIINKTKGKITIENKDSLTKTYDGSPVIDPIYNKVGDGDVTIEYYKDEKLLEKAPVNSGIYKVKVILKEGKNYMSASDEAEFEIKKGTYDFSKIKFEDATFTYDGTEKRIEITGELPEGITVVYDNNNKIDSGEYEVTARFVGDTENCNDIADMKAKLIIQKAQGEITIKDKDNLNKIYDKNPINTPLYDTKGDGEIVIEYYKDDLILEEPPINVGTYKVKVCLKDGKNYVGASDEASFEIQKATYDMSKVKFEDTTYTYDGTEKRIEITGELPEGVVVSYENNVRITSGEQVAIARFTGDERNYKPISDMTAKIRIEKLSGNIMILNKEKLSKIYDGRAVEDPLCKTEGNGEIKIEYYKNGDLLEENPIDVGVYIVKATLKDDENYTSATDEAEFEISKATYDMSKVVFEDAVFIYDGTEKRIEITGELPEGVNVSYENNIQINSGEYEVVAKFTGDERNYNLIPDMNAKLIIKTLQGSIRITNKEELSKIYDGTPVSDPIYDKNGDGDVIIEYYEDNNLLEEAPINAGIYKVKVCLKDGRNYTGAIDEAEFEIKKATYDMSKVIFEDTTFTYDGTEKRIEITGELPEGVTVDYENNNQINSNEYEVIARFMGDYDNYYSISDMTAKLIIQKATYDMSKVKFENKVVKYNGKEKKIEITGELPEGVTVYYENNNQIEVGIYEVIAKFKGDTTNYKEIEDKKAILEIVAWENITFGDYTVVEDDENFYICDVEEGLTVEELINMTSKGTVEVYRQGEKVENEKILTTGTEVRVTVNEKVQKYEIVITGDITGDGAITDSDLLMMARYMIGCEKEREFVKGAYLKAAHIFENSDEVTDRDLLKLARILLDKNI